MATTTVHAIPSGGSYVKKGVTTSIDNGGTIDTTLVRADGFIGTSNTADCVIGFTSQAAGVVTVSARTAGAAAVGVTIYWEAWQRPQST